MPEETSAGEKAALLWMRYEGGRVWHIARPRPFGSTFVTMRPLCGFSGERIGSVLSELPLDLRGFPRLKPCKGCSKAAHAASPTAPPAASETGENR